MTSINTEGTGGGEGGDAFADLDAAFAGDNSGDTAGGAANAGDASGGGDGTDNKAGGASGGDADKAGAEKKDKASNSDKASGKERGGSLLDSALGSGDGDKKTAKAGGDAGAGDTTEELPEDKIKLPADASEERKSQFSQMREVTKGLRAQVAELEGKLKGGTKPDASAGAELETLRRERRELADRLAAYNIREHPDYIKNFTEPKQKALEVASAILKESGIENAPDLAAVLAKPRGEASRAIQELVNEMPDLDKADFMAAVKAFRDADFKEREALKDAGNLGKALASQREERQRGAFDRVFGDGDQTGFLREITIDAGADDVEKSSLARYNDGVRAVRQGAEKYAFGALTDEGMALIAKKAATLDFIIEHGMPRLEAEYRKVVELNNEMAAKLKGLKAARQSGTPGGGTDDGGEPDAFAELDAAFR